MLALVATGCATYVGRAKKSYQQGLYLETAESLGAHEEDVPYLDAHRQIDYGIYRGAALLMLGDAPNAGKWLSFARMVARENPGALKPEQRVVLEQAEAQLAARIGVGRPPPPASPLPPPPAGPLPGASR